MRLGVARAHETSFTSCQKERLKILIWGALSCLHDICHVVCMLEEIVSFVNKLSQLCRFLEDSPLLLIERIQILLKLNSFVLCHLILFTLFFKHIVGLLVLLDLLVMFDLKVDGPHEALLLVQE